MSRTQALATRWLGVGLATIVAVVTVALALTGRLGLYINPDSAWFAVSMAVLVLVGAVASFTLPLGAEADHGHDHGDAPEHGGADHDDHDHHRPSRAGAVATVVGGAAASAIVVLTLVLPPTSLSIELAMARDVGAPPLFAGQDVVTLATTGDTESFGVGEWSSVFATTTNPEAFDGDPVTLIGFVTPGDAADFGLSRLVITHCVIDAQPASVPVLAQSDVPETGQWVEITGTVRSSSDGRLAVVATTVEQIPEPQDPYEY
ncbi:TIGR03943 family protein [Microbacterium awajiense]|uniref:TIGR03943 family protein n=1 Tax=Microbacterium awajiense TaxID=415214 RepID=A0ABP7AQ94_9MICO